VRSSLALAAASGPVLDIGCGRGRYVHAAILGGHLALGIDVSETAVRIAQRHGLPVLCRSVFQELPGEGTWGTALLLDGNIGIGRDPVALLRRCAQLVRDGDGRILVETPRGARTVERRALHGCAAAAGLVACREWSARGRSFAEYARA
jgi:SAM-dependent methyltransferase